MLSPPRRRREARATASFTSTFLLDELLYPGPAGFGKMRDQKLVEPFAGVVASAEINSGNDSGI